TLTGETLRGSVVEGGRGVKGLLAPKREIRELSVRREEVDLRLAEARAAETRETTEADGTASDARALETRIHDAEKDLVAFRHEPGGPEEEQAGIARKSAVLDTERAQAEAEQGAAAVRLAEIELALGSAEAERTAGADRLTSLGVAVADARAASDAAQ